jgi:hypothetical protein
MILYSVSELSAEPPHRRFVFVNWNEDDDAALEIDATAFVVRSED